MMRVLLALILLTTFSCKRLKPQPKEETVFAPFLSTSSLYLQDHTDSNESKSIFETLQWYTYDFMGGHIIWSNLDIYAVNTGRATYYFQIEDFYDPNQAAGISNPKNFALFSVNVLTKTGIENLTIDAYACGAAQADPAGYAACQADPERNQFTYLNLSTLSFVKMSDTEAHENNNWHVAFKDFEIKINNGINGPGRNLAGLAYRNESFFQLAGGDIIPALETIKNAKLSGTAVNHFDRVTTNIRYFLPKGEERVIHESDWFKKNDLGEKEAVGNTWIIKSNEGNSFFKFSVDQIQQDNGESQISFALNYQGPQSFEFSEDKSIYTLPTITDGTKAEYCIDLDTGELNCSNNLWDLRFEANENGDWFLWTRNGAIPLVDKEIALSTNSAL